MQPDAEPVESIDPAGAAIESYIEATTGTGGSEAGFPWVGAIGFLLLAAAVFVLVVTLRRRFS